MSIVLTPFARVRLFPRDGRATAIRDGTAEAFERRLMASKRRGTSRAAWVPRTL